MAGNDRLNTGAHTPSRNVNVLASPCASVKRWHRCALRPADSSGYHASRHSNGLKSGFVSL